MASFKVPCPSCEAAVLITNPKLIGQKVECPKCKYRFKVEAPAEAAVGAAAGAGGAAGAAGAAKPDAAKPDAKAAAADKKKPKAPGGKKKKLVPILVGVGAVILLAVVGSMMFGGGDKKGTSGLPGGPGNPNNNPGVKPGDDDPTKKPKDDGPPPPPPVPFSTKNTTHLLPGQAVAIYRFNLDRVRESPAYDALADTAVTAAFRESMGFEMGEVDTYFHVFAGEGRDPFGVIKLKTPVKPEHALVGMALQSKPKAVKGKQLFAVRSNPFVSAVSHALSMPSLFGEFYETVPMARPAGTKDKPMGVCAYDTQHILIGEYALLDQFLGSLDNNGYPPFKTALIVAPPPPPKEEKKDGVGVPPDPKKIDPPKKPVEPVKPPAPGEPVLTSTDTYRTIEFPLKKALDELEADRVTVPMVVYAEKFDLKQYDPRLLKKEYQLLASVLNPIAARTRYLSGNVVNFSQRRLTANLRITLGSLDDSRTLAKEQVGPALEFAAEKLKLLLTAPVEFRDYTVGGSTTAPNSGIPDDPMRGAEMQPGMGQPKRPPGGIGNPMPIQPMGPTGGSGMGPPMGPPSGSGMGPPKGMKGPPGLFGPPGGPKGYMPPLGGDDPVDRGYGGNTEEPKEPAAPTSHLDLGMIDNQLLIAVNLHWTDTTYRTVVAPRLMGVANQIKGKMAIFATDFSWHRLAEAGPKHQMATKTFPRGTADRKSNQDRLGLAYPPLQRVSFFAELLPYMGRGSLAATVNKNLAWYDEKNLPAAGSWVPELLVPYYPQTAWRANSPYTPDHTLGATNYVGIAGVGLDIARENPNSDEFKKQVGMTGYGWGSKAEEVTDGLSNTIYLMQTPPGLQQPWIAGGGATVRGLDENDPMSGFRYTHPGRDKQGTYALMGDGSVRWIPGDINPKVLKAMATRAGGDGADLADVDKSAPRLDRPQKPEPKREPPPEPTGAVESAPAPREKGK
jgi:hypothetical protein